MMKTLPPNSPILIVNRKFDRLSYSQTFSPSNMKIYRPMTSKTTINKTVFTNQIEKELKDSLSHANNDIDVFYSYQKAFDSIIHHFSAQANIMNKIKTGYDSIIQSLLQNDTYNNQQSSKRRQSIHSLEISLNKSADKYSRKKAKFSNLIEVIHGNIDYLNQEISSYEKEIEIVSNEIMGLHLITSREKASLQEYIKDAEDSQINMNKSALNKKKVSEQHKEIKSEYESITKIIEESLQHHFQQSQKKKLVHQRIDHLKNSITNTNTIKASKIEEVQKLKNAKAELEKQIKDINQKQQDILKNDSNILERINRLLVVSHVDISLREKYSDPVKLLAVYISHINEFDEGIDPERFPSLV